MRWELTTRVLGSDQSISLTEAEFASIVTATAGINSFIDTEEKFNVILENYEEYERELLSLALRDLVYGYASPQTGQSDVFTVNRRLLNLLSSARQYVDQLRRDVSRAFGRDNPRLSELECRLEDERGRSFAYRLMEAVRNHAQHHGVPINCLNHSMELAKQDMPPWIRYAVTPGLDLKAMDGDRRVDRAVVQELRAVGDSGDFSVWVREYVDCLHNIHSAVRSLFDNGVAEWEHTIQSSLARARATFGEELGGLAAVAVDGDDEDESVHDEVDVWAGLLERCRALKARVRNGGNSARSYVSGRPPSAKG